MDPSADQQSTIPISEEVSAASSAFVSGSGKKNKLKLLLYILPLVVGLSLFGILGYLLMNGNKEQIGSSTTSGSIVIGDKNQTAGESPNGFAGSGSAQQIIPTTPSVTPITTLSASATPVPASSSGSLVTSLVVYWKVDESTSSSTMVDVHDTYNGSPTGTAIIYGLLGKARSFNGITDVVTIPHNINLNPQSNSFTWSTWLYLDNLYSTPSALLAKNDYQAFEGFVLEYSGNGAVKAILFQPTSQLNAESSYSVVTTKVWNHVVSTWDATLKTLKVFVNGTLVATASSASGVRINPSSDLLVGKNIVGVKDATGSATPVAMYLKGSLDEIGIWSRALSDKEITFLYNSGKGRSYDLFATASATLGDRTQRFAKIGSAVPQKTFTSKLLDLSVSVLRLPLSLLGM